MKMAILATCILSFGSACLAQTTKPGSITIAIDSNSFAIDLYAKLAAGRKSNLFFSPGSIDTALAMVYAGARGDTADQMAQTLHLTLPADQLDGAFAELLQTLNSPQLVENLVDASGARVKRPAYELVVANALWGQKGYAFRPEFTQRLARSYGAGLNQVDFQTQADAARQTINDWVATQTKDKIKDLIPDGALTTMTRMVLTNAIYFKSNWAEQFSKDATANGPFKVLPDKSVDVPMMHQQDRFTYAENDDLQLLEMPYSQDGLSMIIILPRKVDGLADVEKALSVANLSKWSKDKAAATVDVTLPRFKFSSDFSLADELKGMGMTDAFSADKADFSGMTSQERLCVSDVVHKAFVAVDEEGTEAAAATGVFMVAMAFDPEKPKVLRADHPFIFLIRHNSTGEVLFMGRVVNPQAE